MKEKKDQQIHPGLLPLVELQQDMYVLEKYESQNKTNTRLQR
jgi:hypothetical protein